MKIALKLNSVRQALSVTAIVGVLAFPAVASASSLPSERSQESTDSKTEALIQDVLNESSNSARRGFPRRRGGGGSRFVGTALDRLKSS